MSAAPTAPVRAKRRPAWVFPLLLIAQFIALLLVLELAMALFYPVRFRKPLPKVPDTAWTTLLHRKSTAPGLAYELNPGASAENIHGIDERHGVPVKVNSLGFRGPEISFEKPANTLRIVAMGASVAFGWTVTSEESYPQQLESKLNARVHDQRHYEVLNFGVGGYATRDEVAALEAKALPLKPDLVIVDFHPNGPESEPVQPLHQVFHEPEWWEKWNLLRLLAYARRRWGIETLGHGREYSYLASPEGPHWPTLLKAFDKLHDLCEPRGLRVLITVFPTYGGLADWKDYLYADIHAQVAEAARARGFMVVDMLPVYVSSGRTVAEIAADDEHPGAIGCELAARELERVIVEHHQELLKMPPP